MISMGKVCAMKTTKMFTREEADQQWYVVDAQGQVLGRMATKIADVLRGKNKAAFTPNADIGDFVIAENFPPGRHHPLVGPAVHLERSNRSVKHEGDQWGRLASKPFGMAERWIGGFPRLSVLAVADDTILEINAGTAVDIRSAGTRLARGQAGQNGDRCASRVSHDDSSSR